MYLSKNKFQKNKACSMKYIKRTSKYIILAAKVNRILNAVY